MLVARPGIVFARYLVTNQAMAGPFSNLIRWQSHWHVVRQSWAFFQNDFAGRISNRVMQTGPAVRESLVSSVTAVWYIVVYGTTALIMMAAADLWLAMPVLVWFAGYIALLVYFVPRMRDRSKITLGGALGADGPHRRQLHQHPHRQAVRAAARRGRLRARRGRLSHRAFQAGAAADHRVRHHPRRAQRRCWSPAPARWRWCCGATARSRSAPSPWCCR